MPDTPAYQQYVPRAGALQRSGVSGQARTADAVLDQLDAAAAPTPEQYGAAGDGATDDTAAVQAAINAAVAAGGAVRFRGVVYRITDDLTVAGSCSLEGTAVHALYGPRSAADSDVVPTVGPYLTGTVLLQTTAGKNILKLAAAGRTVNLRNLGLRFADAIKFVNTGHGVLADPPAYLTYKDNGLTGGRWESVYVYGHDGDHYAFRLVNAQLMVLSNVAGWGGGGIDWETNTAAGWYGNSTLVNPYFFTHLAGTAHGYHLHNVVGGHGCILMTFVRPQSFFLTDGSFGGTPPTASQYCFKVDGTDTNGLTVVGPDFERGDGNNAVSLPADPLLYSTWLGGFVTSPDPMSGTTILPGNLSAAAGTFTGRGSFTAAPSIDGDARQVLSAVDASGFAAGVGGGLAFWGRYNSGGNIGLFAAVVGSKENAADGNYAGRLGFVTRVNGGAPTYRGYVTSDGKLLWGTGTDDGSGAVVQVNGTASATALYGGSLRVEGNDYTVRVGTGANYYQLGRSSSDGLFYFYATQTGANGYAFGGVDGNWFRVGAPAVDGDDRSTAWVYDHADYAAGAGGGVSFWGRYNSGGNFGNFASVLGQKENAADGNYAGCLDLLTRVHGGSPTRRVRLTSAGLLLISNTPAAPGSNPSGGGYLYVDAGALKYRGSGGTVTTVAVA